MSVDITIGKREERAPLFPCALAGSVVSGCAGQDCRHCLLQVKQEQVATAPPIKSATAQGMKTGGFNFTSGSNGFYWRWLEETGIITAFPMLNFPGDPYVTSIPDKLPSFLHRLAVEIELGIIKTKYPKDDAEFTCWFAWWCSYAVQRYGLHAAIQLR